MEDRYDLRKRTTLSCMDNTDGLWWQRKGSVTSKSPLVHLIQLQSMRQRFRQYMPRHNFASMVYNSISYRPSRSQDLTDSALLTHMDTTYPHMMTWVLCTLPSTLVSAVISVLRWTASLSASLLVYPLLTMGTGQSSPRSSGTCPLTPYSSHTGTRSPSSNYLQGNTVQGPLHQVAVKYNHARLSNN